MTYLGLGTRLTLSWIGMANLSPELGEAEEDEMGARLRLENLVGSLMRAVGGTTSSSDCSSV